MTRYQEFKLRVQNLLKEFEDCYPDYSLSENSGVLKITISLQDLESKADYDRLNTLFCKRKGLDKNVVGMCFESRGKQYRITSIKPKNRTYPFIALEIKSGQHYKFSKEQIVKYLGGSKLINRTANLDELRDIMD